MTKKTTEKKPADNATIIGNVGLLGLALEATANTAKRFEKRTITAYVNAFYNTGKSILKKGNCLSATDGHQLIIFNIGGDKRLKKIKSYDPVECKELGAIIKKRDNSKFHAFFANDPAGVAGVIHQKKKDFLGEEFKIKKTVCFEAVPEKHTPNPDSFISVLPKEEGVLGFWREGITEIMVYIDYISKVNSNLLAVLDFPQPDPKDKTKLLRAPRIQTVDKDEALPPQADGTIRRTFDVAVIRKLAFVVKELKSNYANTLKEPKFVFGVGSKRDESCYFSYNDGEIVWVGMPYFA